MNKKERQQIEALIEETRKRREQLIEMLASVLPDGHPLKPAGLRIVSPFRRESDKQAA